MHHALWGLCNLSWLSMDNPYMKSTQSSSWQVTQWLPSSQNLVYLSASIKLFNSPQLLTSTLIIHPLSYGLELIYIKVAKSEIIINEMKKHILDGKKEVKLHQLKEIGNVNEFFKTMKMVNQHFQRPINLFR